MDLNYEEDGGCKLSSIIRLEDGRHTNEQEDVSQL